MRRRRQRIQPLPSPAVEEMSKWTKLFWDDPIDPSRDYFFSPGRDEAILERDSRQGKKS